MIYVTADLHLFHKNIIEYDELPYADVYEMNEDLIDKWNRTVSVFDTVFCLGDFALTNRKVSNDKIENLVRIYKNLNGEKIFIKGNHDGSKFINALKDVGQTVYNSFTFSGTYVKQTTSDRNLEGIDEKFLSADTKYHLIHNPMPFVTALEENHYLIYGHLHRLVLQHDRTHNACICNQENIESIIEIIKKWQYTSQKMVLK